MERKSFAASSGGESTTEGSANHRHHPRQSPSSSAKQKTTATEDDDEKKSNAVGNNNNSHYRNEWWQQQQQQSVQRQQPLLSVAPPLSSSTLSTSPPFRSGSGASRISRHQVAAIQVDQPLTPLPQAIQSQHHHHYLTMNMNVNITTNSRLTKSSTNNNQASPTNAGGPLSSIGTGGGNNNNNGVSQPPSSGRKRKGGHSKKKDKDAVSNDNNSTFEKPSSSNPSSAAAAKSPFEKLNTLKLLLDCGHLTNEEYQERKNQIINEMTGTSTERKKPSPRRTLQPIMKTVVPHNPPDFSRILKERAEKLSFEVDTLEWTSTSTRIKLDLVPFATGQLRNAYYLQEVGDGAALDANGAPRLLVAKFSIRQAEPSSYLSDVEMQAVCAHYAQLYNEHEPPLKVYYARSWLLKLRDRGDLVCSVEEYLPGSYVKYSNNSGYVGKETSTTEERERNTPQSFSHFTFVASDYRLMVVDIQGVNDSYTDPQIHTADGRGFGAGNLGTFGMEKFLESHRCNEVCKWLGLRSINEQYKPGGTAAPPYQMPFSSGIKKSTNRITEERNTFSTSVTVSEAFGGSDILKASLDERSSSSYETGCETGSSSLLYVQQQQLLSSMSNSSMGVRKFHAIAPSGSVSGRNIGLPLKSGDSSEEHSGGEWWRVFKRLLCWCYSV